MTMAVIHSNIGGHISKEAYGEATAGSDQNKNDRYGAMNSNGIPVPARLVENGNIGDGAITESLADTCTVLSDTDAEAYTNLVTIFGKDTNGTSYDCDWTGDLVTYDATINYYDGTEVIHTQKDYIGTTLDKLYVAPAKENQTFVAWYTTPTFDEGTEYDTGLDRQAMTPIAKHFLGVKKEIIDEFGLKGYFDVNPNVLDFQIPGGMLSNLVNQLKEMGMADKYQDLLDEMPRVRADLGYPPLVTPSSQIVGTMATFNVMTGERYKMVPDEFKKLARGEFGRTPQPVNPEVLEKCGIKEEDLVTCRPADLLEPGMDKFKAELAAKGFPNASEEDVLSYALFPAVAEEFFKKRTVKTLKELGIANPTDEDVLLYNLDAEVAKKFFAAK